MKLYLVLLPALFFSIPSLANEPESNEQLATLGQKVTDLSEALAQIKPGHRRSDQVAKDIISGKEYKTCVHPVHKLAMRVFAQTQIADTTYFDEFVFYEILIRLTSYKKRCQSIYSKMSNRIKDTDDESKNLNLNEALVVFEGIAKIINLQNEISDLNKEVHATYLLKEGGSSLFRIGKELVSIPRGVILGYSQDKSKEKNLFAIKKFTAREFAKSAGKEEKYFASFEFFEALLSFEEYANFSADSDYFDIYILQEKIVNLKKNMFHTYLHSR